MLGSGLGLLLTYYYYQIFRLSLRNSLGPNPNKCYPANLNITYLKSFVSSTQPFWHHLWLSDGWWWKLRDIHRGHQRKTCLDSVTKDITSFGQYGEDSQVRDQWRMRINRWPAKPCYLEIAIMVYRIRDVNFVFFQKSIFVLKKSIFFRLSNFGFVRRSQ